MTINVTKYRLNPDRIFAGTRGSYGMEKLSFDFGDGWDFDTISVTFHPQRGKPIKLPILPGTEIDIPAEVMEHSGESRFVVSGRAVGEDGTIERQAITLEGYVDVAYTADEKGGNTRKVTADMYDRLIDQASKIFDEAREDVSRSASDAEGFANAAEENAEAAKAAEEQALKYKGDAETASKEAQSAANEANTSAKSASTAAVAAAENAAAALQFAESAAESQRNAAESATAAELIRESVANTAENIENTVQETLQQAKDSGDFDGADGYSPTAKAERVENGVRVTITDKDGTTSKVVQDGESGVHVGSDTPPAGTRVWVNPNGERTKIPQVDETLAKPGYAADAAKVGEKIDQLSGEIVDTVKTTAQALTNEQKAQVMENIGALAREQKKTLTFDVCRDSMYTYSKDSTSGKQLGMYRSTEVATRASICPMSIHLTKGTTYTITLGESAYTFARLGIVVYKGSNANVEHNYNPDAYGVTWFEGEYEYMPIEGVPTTGWVYENSMSYTANDDNLYMLLLFKRLDGTSLTDDDVAVIENDFSVVYKESPEYVPSDMGDENAYKYLVTNSAGKVVVGESLLTMPQYWQVYLDEKLPAIREKVADIGVDADMFMYFTDHHIGTKQYLDNSNNTRHIIDLIREHTPVDKVFFGGDILNTTAGQTHEQAMYWMWKFHDDYIDARNVYPVIGNHEISTNYDAEGNHITYAEAYSVLFKKLEDKANINKKMYYTVDNVAQRVKYVVLDTESEEISGNAEQLQWLVDTLSELENGWTVVLFAHSYIVKTSVANTIISQICGDYKNRKNGSNDLISWDFTNAAAEIACLICGHVHADTSSVENGLLVICTTTDAGANPDNAIEDGREPGLITEQAVDVFYINTADKTIDTIRLGYGVDRSWVY